MQYVSDEKVLADRGTARIEQLAFAEFLIRGELDRHLRRMRSRYRRRRDALVEGLCEAFPEASIDGVAAGLHLTLQLLSSDNEVAIREQARLRRVEIETMIDFTFDNPGLRPGLVLGYARMSESAIRAGVRELAEAVNAARSGSG